MTRKRPNLTVVSNDPPSPPPHPPPPAVDAGVTAVLQRALEDHLRDDTSALIIIRVTPSDNANHHTYTHFPPPSIDGADDLRQLHFFLSRAAHDTLVYHNETSPTVRHDIDPDDDGA